MKTVIQSEPLPIFAPVKVEVTFETKEELLDFYHRMRCSHVKVNESINQDAVNSLNNNEPFKYRLTEPTSPLFLAVLAKVSTLPIKTEL